MSTITPNMRDIIENLQGAEPTPRVGGKNQMDKDDFLKLMLAQMKNQDPTKPVDSKDMAAQMAQFASMEQLVNIGKGIDKLNNQQDPQQRLLLGTLIGKTAKIDSGRVVHEAGKPSVAPTKIPEGATKVKVKVLDVQGELVKEWEEKVSNPSEHRVRWDGTNKMGLPEKSGNFVIRLEPQDDRGVAIPLEEGRNAIIKGVDFSSKDPVLLLDNDAKISFSQVRSIQDMSFQKEGNLGKN